MSPPPSSTVTAALSLFGACITTFSPNFSEYHLALASMSATYRAKKAPVAAREDGSVIGLADCSHTTGASVSHRSKQIVFLMFFSYHSLRKAVSGSINVARRAGAKQASAATAASASATASQVSGSVGSTAKSSVDINRV